MTDLSVATLAAIARDANVFQTMGENKCRMVRLDYVPAQAAMIIPRLVDDEPSEPTPPQMEELCYFLDDAMFGGEIYAALTCNGRTIVGPFPWTDYETLSKTTILL